MRDNLAAGGFEVLCPYDRLTFRRKVRNQNKWVVETVERAVFPNYLFFRAASVPLVRETRGVLAVVSNRAGPLVIPERAIARLRAVMGSDGLVSAKDASKLSSIFKGKVGQSFEFKNPSPLAGLIGRISSLADLDTKGELKAFVSLLGGERELSVPHTYVGQYCPGIAASVAA